MVELKKEEVRSWCIMPEKKRGRQGLFLSIEGPDGAGKTTQAALLKSRLEGLGLEVVLTREPGGTPIGEEIRKLLLNPDFFEMTLACEILLYSAARAQLVTEFIIPSLQKGRVVISDRYLDSNLVYQGFAGGEKVEVIKKINMWATGGLVPDITFLLDLDAETGLQRLNNSAATGGRPQADRMERKELSYHRKVRQGFLQLAALNCGRIFLIRAADKPEIVHERIWQKTLQLLSERNCKT